MQLLSLAKLGGLSSSIDSENFHERGTTLLSEIDLKRWIEIISLERMT